MASASALAERRVRVKVGRGLALGDSARYDDVDDAAVLGVHAAERVQSSPALCMTLNISAIVDHQHVGVGHEELEDW